MQAGCFSTDLSVLSILKFPMINFFEIEVNLFLDLFISKSILTFSGVICTISALVKTCPRICKEKSRAITN